MHFELDIKFDLSQESQCEQMAMNKSNLYCFYWKGSVSMVQIQSIKHRDMEPVNLRTSTFGTDYQVLIDNAIYVVFLFKQLNSTAFEIVKLDKQINTYEQVYITNTDFGIFNLFISDFNYHFNSENNVLSIQLVNNLTQSLYVYTAFFLTKEMELQKIRTINDSFDLFPLDPTIWGIRCDSKV